MLRTQLAVHDDREDVFFLLSFFYKNRATFKYPNTRRYIATHRPESRVREIHSKKNHFGSIPILNTEIEIEIFFGPMSGEKKVSRIRTRAPTSRRQLRELPTVWLVAMQQPSQALSPLCLSITTHLTHTHGRTRTHAKFPRCVFVCVSDGSIC